MSDWSEVAHFITRFGNSTALVPLTLVVALWLVLRESPRMALLWLLAVGGVVVATALAKMLLSGCHLNLWQVRSPSGHASFSTVSYGGLAIVLGGGMGRIPRRILLVSAMLGAVAIGISRVMLDAHTPAEVVVGLLLGLLGTAVFAAGYRGRRRPRVLVLVLALLGLVLLAQGPLDHITMEPLLEKLGAWLVRRVPICGVI